MTTNKNELYHIIATQTPFNSEIQHYGLYRNRFYVCYQDNPIDNNYPIHGFKCYRFNTYQEADNYVREKYTKISTRRNSIIPICRWVPRIFDKYILNWKLMNIYWLGKHTIYERKTN